MEKSSYLCGVIQNYKLQTNMNIKSIITAAVALLASTACSGGAKQEKVMAKDGKALVVFFSHAGDNYAVGNIEVGNTFEAPC